MYRTIENRKGIFDKLLGEIDRFRPPVIDMDLDIDYQDMGEVVTFRMHRAMDRVFHRTSIDPKISQVLGIYYARKFLDLWKQDLERLRGIIWGVMGESVNEDGLGFLPHIEL